MNTIPLGPSVLPIRLVLSAVALVVLVLVSVNLSPIWTNLPMYAIGFPHYFLALYYSKRGIANVWNHPRGIGLLLAFLPLSFLPWFLPTPVIVKLLVLYFAIHHAMSEVYFDAKDHSKQLRTAHWWAVVSSYFAITGHHLHSALPFQAIGWVGTLVFTTVFFLIAKRENGLSLPSMLRTCPWIFLGPLVALAGEWVYLDWRFLINWHFVFWLFLPYLRKGMFTQQKLRSYWLQNGFMTLALLLLIMWMNNPKFLIGQELGHGLKLGLRNFFFTWSFLHISLSFLVSGGNPDWIKRILSKG